MTVDPSQFDFRGREIVHKPTGARFLYRAGSAIFDAVYWRGEGPTINGFSKCDVWSAAQAFLKLQKPVPTVEIVGND